MTSMRLVMPWIKRAAMETDEHGNKCLPIVLMPRDGLPHKATHVVVQILPNTAPDDMPVAGWAMMKEPTNQ